ncbi:MAG: hypothetical protein ACLFTB_03555 [Desulfovibrionales bacterium]
MAWALVFSFILNTCFLYITVHAWSGDQKAGEEEALSIELLSDLSPYLNEIRRKIAGPENTPQSATLTFVTGEAARPLFDKVRVGISDPSLDQSLRAVREEIERVWEGASPPSWGKVLLVMEVSPQGAILNVGINRVSGPQGLESFVFNLVKHAAPFESAMQGRSEPLWIECEFAVEAVGADGLG